MDKVLRMSVFAACVMTAACGADVITNAFALTVGSGRVLAPAVRTVPDQLPDVATPIFHFDCRDTSGWLFSDAGRTTVTGIPSRVGARTLNVKSLGGSWTGWGVVAPQLAVDASLGEACLDFGAYRSKRGLIFDPDPDEANTNVLDHIGTIFMVRDNTAGGGWFLGGGYGGVNPNGAKSIAGYRWHRAKRDGGTGDYTWDDPILGPNAYTPAARGTFWQDGIPTASDLGPGYLKKGWQVISLQPTEATCAATGIGFGDARDSGKSGAHKIAEFIAYGEVLSDADRAAVEAYLMKKWLGRVPANWNGEAHLASVRAFTNATMNGLTGGVKFTADVPAGATLRLGALQGGNKGGARMTKTGAGTLALTDATAFGGEVTLAGGTLAMTKRAVPSSLPGQPFVHLDASEAGDFTYTNVNDVAYVNTWANRAAANAAYNAQRIEGVKTGAFPASGAASEAPRRQTAAIGTRAAVDFGTFYRGSYMGFVTNLAAGARVPLSGLGTVVAVVGAQDGGAHLLGYANVMESYYNASSFFLRENPARNSSPVWTTPVLTQLAPTFAPQLTGVTAGRAWIDGVAQDPKKGYATPGWQVAAFAVPGGRADRLGGAESWYYSGGLRLGEIAIYNHVLSEEEIRDAQAYLMWKWFGRTAPGYRAAGADLRVVTAQDGAAVDVGSNATVRIASLTAEGAFTKTGAGTLAVQALTNLNGRVTLARGTLKTAAPDDVASSCALAADPILHFDPSDAASLETVTRSERKYIAFWHDLDQRNTVFMNNADYQPWLNETDLQNGRAVADFGPYGKPNVSGSKFAYLARPVDNARTIFVVWGVPDGYGAMPGGFILGSSSDYVSNENHFAFHRGMVGGAFTTASPLLLENDTNRHVWQKGRIWADGTEIAPSWVPTPGFHLMEFRTSAGAHISALGSDRTTWDRMGGMRYGEIVVYNRELTAREHIATRNYLMKRWFGKTDAELEALPAQPVATAQPLDGIEAAGGDLDATEVPVTATRLTGTADCTLRGTVTVRDVSGHVGTARVAAGSALTVSAKASSATPALLTEGLIFRLAADEGVTAVTNGTAVSVTRWLSTVGDGCYAGEMLSDTQVNKASYPAYAAQGLNGRPTVNMAYGQTLRFYDGAGNFKTLDSIRSVFWVVGSQEGGGFLLGGGSNPRGQAAAAQQRYNFHRGGGGTGGVAGDALLNGSVTVSDPDLLSATWWLNGRTVNPTSAGLSGGWDLLSARLATAHASGDGKTSAEALACDGRIMSNLGFGERTGRQRLAELLVYDRALTDAECEQVERWLSDRWGLCVYQTVSAPAGAVSLAAGATLDLAGNTVAAGGVTGAGTVRNGICRVAAFTAGEGLSFATADLVFAPGAVWTIPFTAAGTPCVTIDGTATFAAGLTVNLTGTAAIASLAGTSYPVLQATAYAGLEHLTDAVFAGDEIPAYAPPRFRVTAAGVLELCFGRRGTSLVFR